VIRRIVLAAAIAICAVPALARADDDPDALMEQARVHSSAGRFTEMLAVLERAYALDPRPEILFNMGQAQFNLRRYAEALELYERFIATNPPPRERAVATQAAAVARDRLVNPPPPPRPPADPPRRPAPRPRFDAWNVGLFVGTGVTGAAAGGLYLYARSLAADTSGMYRDYDRRLDRASDVRIAAATAGGVAIALALAAGIRLLATPRDDEVAIAITVDPDHAIGHAALRW
jgi:tetratricopeptide (TPR) repeat protein